MRYVALLSLVFTVSFARLAAGQSNIDGTVPNKHAWGANVGWINLDDTTHFVSVDAATTPVDCDMDHDGVPNGDDIALFVEYLLNSGADWRDVCSGDLETPPDGTIDIDDVSDLVACLLNA